MIYNPTLRNIKARKAKNIWIGVCAVANLFLLIRVRGLAFVLDMAGVAFG